VEKIMKLHLPDWLLKLTGDIYLSKRPMFLMYKPQLHLITGDEIRSILYVISPGDVLLRRWNGYLNTIFTGGSYGHAGLYIGKNTVIHATGQGVIEEDILDFCRADSLCVLDVKNGDTKAAIKIAKQLRGAGYDYDFQSTNKKYYCTELADYCYLGVFRNDYKEIAGNSVLLPDAIRKSLQVECKLEIKH
jgi:uncharacterized protein YycO